MTRDWRALQIFKEDTTEQKSTTNFIFPTGFVGFYKSTAFVLPAVNLSQSRMKENCTSNSDKPKQIIVERQQSSLWLINISDILRCDYVVKSLDV